MNSQQAPNLPIFHSPEVRVVEASAGSGKTFALAKRYIQLLLNPDLPKEHIPIRNILAITFTNKAAFEMKARILEFLKNVALNRLSEAEDAVILKPLGLTRDQARQRAFAVMEDLIHHYNFFQVQTIDKFINGLLSGCAFKIGLTANFRIKTNSREYLEYSLDDLIDLAARDSKISKIFEQFLHHYLYLENRSGWFPKDDILLIIFDLFRHYNTYGLPFREGPFSSEDLVKKKRAILKDIQRLHEQLPEGTDKRFAGILEAFLQKHTIGFDIDGISDYFAREEIPVKKNTRVPAPILRLWEKIHTQLKELCIEEAYSLFNPYIRIFARVQEGFSELSSGDDVLFLEELNKRAGLLFDEERVTVEELYYRLATRFHHYLVDEIQDTSRLQWRNLEKMAEEALSTGGTLFYVGDRKQAIYGFRGGEAELFDEIKQEFQAFQVEIEYLTRNWRSQKAIVDFNNRIFSPENLKRFIQEKEAHEEEKKSNKVKAVVFSPEEMEGFQDIFRHARQDHRSEKSGGYVKIVHVDEDQKESRDEEIRVKAIELILDLAKRFPLKDIAVLARSNFEVEQITNWLLEEGLSVASERTSNIQENALIQELIAFLKFLNSPIDNLAFTEFLLGEIFSKASGIPREDLHRFVFGLRERLVGQKDTYIYTEFREVYPEVWSRFLDEFFRNVGLYPLYELVVSIFYRFRCLENFPGDQGFLMHFLELIKKDEEEHADIGSFLEYFEMLEGEALYVHMAESEAVKVQTIHKSKGLEFPVVILPFLGMNIQVGSQGPDQKQSYILHPENDSMGLLRLKEKYYKFSPELHRLYSCEYKKAFLSELNSIYVGLTRAETELYGFIPKKIGSSFNVAQLLIPEEFCEMGAPTAQEGDKKKDASSARSGLSIPPSRYQDWIGYLKDEFLNPDEFERREVRLQGEVVHFLFSFVGNLAQENLKVCLDRALEEARRQFPLAGDFEEALAKVKRLVEKKSLKPFFDVSDGEVHTEKEVVNRLGHTKRIDRLIVKKDEVWIVDYKSSRDPKADYKKQIAEYKEILTPLYPNRAVKGFLMYLDEGVVDDVEESAAKSNV